MWELGWPAKKTATQGSLGPGLGLFLKQRRRRRLLWFQCREVGKVVRGEEEEEEETQTECACINRERERETGGGHQYSVLYRQVRVVVDWEWMLWVSCRIFSLSAG